MEAKIKTTEMKERNAAEKSEALAAHLSIAGATVIFLISLAVGLISDSVALLLDAGTGLVILFMAVFVKANLSKLSRPPDRRYNFGYEKYESLTVTLQNSAIIFTCLIGIAFATQDIIHPDNVTHFNLPIEATAVSALIALALAARIGAVSKRTGSSMLKTSSLHWFVDSSLSIGMCAGFLLALLLTRAGFTMASAYVDPAMAIILALLIMRLPIKALGGNIRELLDAVPETGVNERISQLAQKHATKCSGVHRMRVRKAGKKMFLDIGFKASGDLTWEKAQALAEDFEQEIKREIPGCDVVVYFKR